MDAAWLPLRSSCALLACLLACLTPLFVCLCQCVCVCVCVWRDFGERGFPDCLSLEERSNEEKEDRKGQGIPSVKIVSVCLPACLKAAYGRQKGRRERKKRMGVCCSISIPFGMERRSFIYSSLHSFPFCISQSVGLDG